MDMLFTSGAGGWGTELHLNGDGYFSGEYHDCDMGDTGPGYPNGKCYISNFSGNLHISDIATHSVTLKRVKLNTSETVGNTWVDNGIQYIASEPYGMNGGEQFILYLPSTPTSSLPDDLVSWSYGRITSGTLGCYALYNVSTGNTFFSE